MRWGKGKTETVEPEPNKFWFAWYPVQIYENRWVWWEWTMRSPGYLGSKWAYETFYDGKRPNSKGEPTYES